MAQQKFYFYARPFENSQKPSLVRENVNGGDEHVLAEFGRINRPDDIYELCRLANLSLATSADTHGTVPSALKTSKPNT